MGRNAGVLHLPGFRENEKHVKKKSTFVRKHTLQMHIIVHAAVNVIVFRFPPNGTSAASTLQEMLSALLCTLSPLERHAQIQAFGHPEGSGNGLAPLKRSPTAPPTKYPPGTNGTKTAGSAPMNYLCYVIVRLQPCVRRRSLS